MSTKVWDIKEFESVPTLHNHVSVTHMDSDEIAEYLQRFVRDKGINPNSAVLMPSVKSFMDLFNCSYAEVLKGFGRLKGFGYEAILPGLYGHISLFLR